MGSYNWNQVMLELESAQPIFKKAAEDYVKKDIFIPATKELRKEFLSHPVTKEIKDGAKYGNDAGSASGAVDVGKSEKNLFTFIGFEQGSNPIEEIEKRLDPSHRDGPKMISLPVVKRRFIYQFDIKGPNLDEIHAKTPIPWMPGFSWVKKLESGIPGLSRFIAKTGYGRSGGGIQAKTEIGKRQRTSNPVDYLTGLFKNFINSFK